MIHKLLKHQSFRSISQLKSYSNLPIVLLLKVQLIIIHAEFQQKLKLNKKKSCLLFC